MTLESFISATLSSEPGLPEPLLKIAEKMINRALQTDVLAEAELAVLEGKSFAIECRKPPVPISMSIGGGAVCLSTGIDESASVVLSGDLPALISLLGSIAQDHSDFSNSGVEIQGEVGALLQLSRALSRLDLDWEHLIAGLIGEMPARLLFLGKERLGERGPYIKEKISEVSTSFMVDQVGLANRSQGSELREGLRQLQYRIDRVQLRMQELQSRDLESAAADKLGGAAD